MKIQEQDNESDNHNDFNSAEFRYQEEDKEERKTPEMFKAEVGDE